MIEYLPQALASLSTALNIGKSLVEIRDSAKLQEAMIQFNSAIIDAQSKIMSSQKEQSVMSAKINELEQECMRLKNWDTERQQYSRKEIGSGNFAYVENNFVGKLQNAHKLCCNCFEKYTKSTLQQVNIPVGRLVSLVCPNGCPKLVFQVYFSP
jgi:hypothetical protein